MTDPDLSLPQWARIEATEQVSARPGAMKRGLFYNLLAAGVQMAGSFLGIVLLARLVPEAAFGIYGAIFPVVSTLMILSDGGTAYITLRAPRPDHRMLSGLFWICILVSVGLSAVAVLAIWGLSVWSGKPQMLMPGILLTAAILLQALGIQHTALVTRFFRNDIRAVSIIAGVLSAVAVSAALAWAGFGILALVAFLAVRVAVAAGTVWMLTGWRPAGPQTLLQRGLGLKGLGLPELLSRALANATQEADKFIAGLVLAASPAGLYVLAHMFAVTSTRQAMAPIVSLLLPHLAEVRRSGPQAYRARMLDLMRLFVLIALPGGIWVCLEAPLVIGLVTGNTASELGQIFAWLFAGSLITIFGQLFTLGVQADDRPDIAARLALITMGLVLAGLGAAIVLPGGLDQVRGVSIARTITLAMALATLWRIRRVMTHLEMSLLRLVRALALPTVLALGLALLTAWLSAMTGSGWLHLLTGGAMVAFGSGVFGLGMRYAMR